MSLYCCCCCCRISIIKQLDTAVGLSRINAKVVTRSQRYKGDLFCPERPFAQPQPSLPNPQEKKKSRFEKLLVSKWTFVTTLSFKYPHPAIILKLTPPATPIIFPRPLEQTIQTTATSQRAHDTRAYATARGTTAPIVLVLALRRRIPLLLVHGLLLVLHRLLLIGHLLLLLAAVVVLAWGRAVGSRAAHGGRRRAVAALLGWVVGTRVLRWVGGGRHVGGFVGHVLWDSGGFGCCVRATEAVLCEGVGSGGR